jgi:hypothetical protein
MIRGSILVVKVAVIRGRFCQLNPRHNRALSNFLIQISKQTENDA